MRVMCRFGHKPFIAGIFYLMDQVAVMVIPSADCSELLEKQGVIRMDCYLIGQAMATIPGDLLRQQTGVCQHRCRLNSHSLTQLPGD